MKIEEPWYIIESDFEKEKIKEELFKEINNKHILFNKNVVPFIKRYDTDDVIFKLENESFALVHLTWSNKNEESSKIPFTEISNDLDTIFVNFNE
ncbi:MAG: hypothetical protein O9346_13650 [Leptospiraceae bacterium]|jgi:hypothetical protein|nr:hypothetical protein [Leptospiraceae bacterium]